MTTVDVRAVVASVLGVPADQLDDGTDLIAGGMSSIAMMRVAGKLKRAGIVTSFAELAERPTVGAWCALAAGRAEAPAAESAVDEGAPFELDPLQHALWIGRRDGQELGGVAAHFYTEFDGGALDPATLERAARAVFARHGMTRVAVDDAGRQRIAAETSWRGPEVHDLRDLAEDERQRELTEVRTRLSERVMDVAAGEVFDIGLTLIGDDATRVHVNVDMVAADAMSLRVLVADLARALAGESLPPIGYSFPRYLADRSRTRAGTVAADREWWLARLADLPGSPALPVESGQHTGTAGGRREHWLDAAACARLKDRAAAAGLTLPVVLATAFAEVVGAWSAERDFLLNVPVFGREPLHDEVDDLVGAFSSSVLLGMRTGLAEPFTTAARRAQDELREAAGHAAFTGVDVLRELTRANHGEQVLAPVVFSSTLDFGELFGPQVRDRVGRPVWMISQGPQVWLDAQVTEHDGGVLLSWDAREQLFAPGVLDAMFGAFTALVDRLAAGEGWETGIGGLLPVDQRAVRELVNATDGPAPSRPLHERFFALADAEPDRIALVWGDDATMTYGELARRARQLVTLLRANGIEPGDAVGITLPKGPDQVIAVLGVLGAGAYYVPSGVDVPAARRAAVHESAGARIVLADDAVAKSVQHEPAIDLEVVDGEDVMYVIFTSGSTGVPKGVEVPHRAAANTIEAVNDHFGVTSDDRTIALSALDFDLSVYDLFAFLGFGGSVVLLDEDQRRDAHAWAHLVRRWDVSVVSAVPALLDMLIVAGQGRGLGDALWLVMLGGDWVTVDLPTRLRELRPGCRFAGLGGMTEAAIHVTICEVGEVDPRWRTVPYGKPFRNTRYRVVDSRGHDCPDWVPGELWVSGTGVALGYQHDPDRTAEKFVEQDGRRWYRTGDGARCWPDGTVEFLGRTDHQVKIRGHRIELGEIDAALTAFPGVAQGVALVTPERRIAAVVTTSVPEEIADPFLAHLLDQVPDADVTWRDRVADAPSWSTLRWTRAGDPLVHRLAGRTDELVALLESGTDPEPLLADLDEQALVGSLAERLPSVMVPDHVVVLPSLPLTRNGKVDRAAIARTVAELATEDLALTPPVGAVEETVAAVWSDLLGVPVTGREQNFFQLGGDSLLATRLVGRLAAAGLADVALAKLFGNPVLADFAATLTTGETAVLAPVVADPAHRFEPFPPTDVQRAYWVGRGDGFTLGGVGSHFYREYAVADLDVARLEAAVDALVARHDMLRVVFLDDGSQQVLEHVPPFRVQLADDPREAWSHHVFDPSAWPLFSVTVGAGVLAIGTDNLVFDALSVLTFYSELGALYENPAAELPPVGLTFRDYLLGPERDTTAATEYWHRISRELPPGPRLPLALDPASITTPRFARRSALVPAAQWQAITARVREHGLTPSAVLLTAFAEVLGRWSAQPDLTVNVTLFDRREVHPDIHNVIGDFTSLLLVDHRPEAGEPWLAGARRLQRRMWDALDHREVSAVKVLRSMARDSGVAEVTMPVVFTSALGLPARANPLLTEQVHGISQTPQVWLDHQVSEVDGGVELVWDAVEGLFPDGLVDAMFEAYRTLVGWLAAEDWTATAPDLLPAAQRERRTLVNATTDVLPDVTLHDGFFRHARENPGRPALLGTEVVTYGELADRALRVAAALDVEPGEPVAVTLPKGAEQIVAVLGVLAAGGAYVPIGVDQPQARRERIHALAGVRTAVTPKFVARAQSLAPAEPVFGDPDRLAYVIFTSGSTGEPKGVEITHRAAMNTIVDVSERYEVGPDDRGLAVSALDFDLSVYDLFGLLSAGGALVLVEEDARRDARRWHELVVEHGVTVWNTVPALLDMLLVVAGPLPLRVVLVSGDWVGLDLPDRLAQVAPDCRFTALGGATEASIWSNFFEVDAVDPAWPSIPYGYPLRNQRFRVVDAFGRDCPDWVEGELWIGGAGVARGYRGAPERTAAQFAGGWYRTGDLGRYWPCGTLEFLGRRDQQVKIRGHRIELGEVEAALSSAPGVGQAVASVVEGSLVAAVVPAALPAAVAAGGHDGPAPDHGAETVVVAPLLTELLKGEIAAEHEPTARVWRAWLSGPARQDLAARVWRPMPFSAREDAVGRSVLRARELVDLYRDVLAGRTPATALLDEPLLAPASIVASAAREALSVVRAEIAGLTGAVAVWGVPADLGREVTTVDGLVEAVPESLRGRFDVVVANNVLHRYPDVRRGVAVAALLCAPGGRVIVVEPEELAPIGLLTAAVLEHGFTALDPARRDAGSPMLPARRWAEELASFGLTGATHRPAGNGLAVITATVPESVLVLDLAAVRAHAATRVPDHMVPERVEVLPWISLSPNGKVDRRALGGLRGEDSGEAPRGHFEVLVASLWAELLGVPVTGRAQSFFVLGGDSLLATRFIQQVEQRHGVVLPLRKLFAGPTVAQAAALFAEAADTEEGEL
ncbi:non-ribosomal peptide synthetase [Lentzea sp. NBRC 102530]|uniref:non-ribosomal peptide synthetase n=1 Tax=Lentzea sp. NBRC 102530 TaxID=3032201 RepID=UPI0024A1C7D7|nr:non-ribosomal peptide synthetase [Lentzea sp. NBRC 102530]GLY51401.1 non-ribosomal peptide synthetase [Lentzea sp. NBRC 102530]